MRHRLTISIIVLTVMILGVACFESKRDYEFAPGWFEDSSRIPSPADAPHGYFEIYYMPGQGRRCLVDDRARTMRDLGDGCILYPTDSVAKGFIRAQCVGRVPVVIKHEWDESLEHSPKRLVGAPFAAWKDQAQRQPLAACVERK